MLEYNCRVTDKVGYKWYTNRKLWLWYLLIRGCNVVHTGKVVATPKINFSLKIPLLTWNSPDKYTRSKILTSFLTRHVCRVIFTSFYDLIFFFSRIFVFQGTELGVGTKFSRNRALVDPMVWLSLGTGLW